jgi:hypothetical protein
MMNDNIARMFLLFHKIPVQLLGYSYAALAAGATSAVVMTLILLNIDLLIATTGGSLHGWLAKVEIAVEPVHDSR